jgi:hypothetical protein
MTRDWCGRSFLAVVAQLTISLTNPNVLEDLQTHRGYEKGPMQGLHVERMMGLEPTTFCMASRRSSQLSYIRGTTASIASGFGV